MIRFILNNENIETNLPAGTLLLDFIRYHQHLTGTKIGCREGDCGACTVLIGEINSGELEYKSVTSCLTPIGNAHHKHILTVEGLNFEGLNPIQQAICDEGGTQCGFCTPGFIVSMAGFCLSKKEPSYSNAIASVDGNICRCTGYKSIERALMHLSTLLTSRKKADPIEFATSKSILPSYLKSIKNRLRNLSLLPNGLEKRLGEDFKFIGGGTDLYVQQHEAMVEANISLLANKKELKGITREENTCIIGAAATVTDLMESPVIQQYFPNINNFTKLVSSTPIRNIATLGGNFVNASPIGDFTIFFLALDAWIKLTDGYQSREILLRDFYKGYKQLDKSKDEFISQIKFALPAEGALFNFEKVSKRTHLDIASVNSAICIRVAKNLIEYVSISAGGIAPIPLFLTKTSDFLKGKILDEELIGQAVAIAQTEVSPISDARGTEAYKRLLLSQLIKAHFIRLFPALLIDKILAA